MKVFLTGGTGFVGGAVARALRRRGHAIRALVRDPARARDLGEQGAELVKGDIVDAPSLRDATRGCEAAIHLIGIIREKGRYTFEAVHTRGTTNVLAAAREAGVRRFVQMSALGAKSGGTEYHRTKHEAEERVRRAGIPFAILRPSLIFGRASPVVQLWLRMVRLSPVVPVLGDGRYRLQPVFVDDVAAAFVRAAERSELTDGVYEIAGPEVLTYDEVLDAVAQAMGKRIRKWHIPLAIVWPPVRLAAALRLPAPIAPHELQMLLEENVAAEPANALADVFGLEPRSFREWLREAA
ncbi:MAG: complex I NDUFA9 subunit family protein [Gemmatimonadota bacterium]